MRKTILKSKTVTRTLMGMCLLIGLGFCPSYVKAEGETAKEKPVYNIPEVSAVCGQKLSESKFIQPDNGKIVWQDENKVVKEGDNIVYATFVPNDTEKYEQVEGIEIKVNVLHNDPSKLLHVKETKTTEDEEGLPNDGLHEHYECPVCKKLIGTDYKVHDEKDLIIPNIEKDIELILGQKAYLGEFIVSGDEGVESAEIIDAEKYEKFVKYDSESEEFTSPKKVKYYKKKIGTPVLLVKDHMGKEYKRKLHLRVKEPTFKVNKEYKNGLYQYTLKCEAEYADDIKIEATEGLANKATKKKLNSMLKKGINKNIKVSKKKAYVKYVFNATRDAIKDGITFKATAVYGKNISLSSEN